MFLSQSLYFPQLTLEVIQDPGNSLGGWGGWRGRFQGGWEDRGPVHGAAAALPFAQSCLFWPHLDPSSSNQQSFLSSLTSMFSHHQHFAGQDELKAQQYIPALFSHRTSFKPRQTDYYF